MIHPPVSARLMCAAAALALAALPCDASSSILWLEAEDAVVAPASARQVLPDAALLSGSNAVQISIVRDAAAREAPDGFIALRLDFTASAAESRSLWARVGLENVGSPFEWRVNDGPWSKVRINDMAASESERRLSFDVVELGFWLPVAWAELGEAQLREGSNTLELRVLPKERERDGQRQADGFAFIADVFCLASGPFWPDHHRRPDQRILSDADRAAATHHFIAPVAPADGGRAEISLTGAWEYAAWDEVGPIADRTGPVAALPERPEALHWRALAIPGDRNAELPDFQFNHRFLMRTRVAVPADWAGRAAMLRFEGINLMATLFVNGERAGHFDIPRGQWDCDVTAHIAPGRTNELVVAIKDAFYAIDAPGQDGLRAQYYLPMSFFERNQSVTHRFDYPVKEVTHAGLIDEVRLISPGRVYVADAFVKTSVQAGQIAVETTLRNASDAPASVALAAAVRGAAEETASLTIDPVTVTVPAQGEATVTLATPWTNATLWWPDAPHVYVAELTVTQDARAVDRFPQRFGFREWEIRGDAFYLNGVRQHLRADLDGNGGPPGGEPDAALRQWREQGMNMFRLRFQYRWAGMTPRQLLGWMDEAGMPVRVNLGTFDGQHASYRLVEDAPGGGRRARAVLFDNWRRQLLNRARALRNHPSAFVWELDNEIIYINSRNLGTLDQVEPEFEKAARELKAFDPTRDSLIAGGNALRNQSLAIYGGHYYEVAPRHYPDDAYTLVETLAGQGHGWNPWPVERGAKPIFLSETAFLPGWEPASFAAIGGEAAFLGRAETVEPAGVFARMLAEGYRWAGLAGVHMWLGRDTTGGAHHKAWQPIALLGREWNWTFASGADVPRTFRLFNDHRTAQDLEVAWSATAEGTTLLEGNQRLSVPAGGWSELPFKLRFPSVATITEGQLRLTVRRDGETVFTDDKPFRLLPDQAQLPAGGPDLVVWDPDGGVRNRFAAHKVEHRAIQRFEEIPDDFRLLVVGRNAVTPVQAGDPRWLAWAAAGRKVLVLDQHAPLRFRALPADLEPTTHSGRIAFAEDVSHPIFDGLDQPDLFCWSGDHVVYRNAYRKATRGAKSLAHADDNLAFSVLAQCPAGDGLLLLCQLAVAEKLDTDAPARRLFDNLVRFAWDYAPVRNRVLSTFDPQSNPGRAITELGLALEPGQPVAEAVRNRAADIVLAPGDATTLTHLLKERQALETFWGEGGWLMVFGVGPDSVSAFNQLVDVDHVLRPFRMEKVTMPSVRDPLTAGLSLRDVVMYSGKRLYEHASDQFYSDRVFTHIVDYDDIAPFAQWPGPEYFNDPGVGPGSDTWPLNMVNGIDGRESWKYIFSIHLNAGDPVAWDIQLPRRETVTGFSIIPNTIYHEIRTVRLTFDGRTNDAIVLDLTALGTAEGRRDMDVPARSAERITIEMADWAEKGRQDVIGVDNVWIRVKRDLAFYDKVRPLLNIGGLVRYPIGSGGVILNQLDFDPTDLAENLAKKKNITATLLRNMGATFSGGSLIAAGHALDQTPIPLDGVANLFISKERGFPDAQHDFSAFPVGERDMAGIRFLIRDFKTSPLENAVTLRGIGGKVDAPESIRIPLNRRADALFFLHTLKQKAPWEPRRRRGEEDTPPTVFEYGVRYEDGSETAIPVRLTRAIDDWLTEEATAGLPEAALAWTGDAGSGRTASVFQMQWDNPHPDRPIASIELRYAAGGAKFGAPIVFGITAATLKR